jgi:hypothetical protein
MATKNYGTNLARAALGQGLGMGWGDEAEAWLRAKSGEGDYEQNLNKIRKEYGQFSKENPYASGTAEFAGGFVPGVAAMFVPGGQAAGAAQMQRSTLNALARLAATGVATGAISGAGSAEEGDRGSNAVSGGVIGGTLGVTLPVGMRAGKGLYNWAKERIRPTDALTQQRALEKFTEALSDSGMSPNDIKRIMQRDRALNIPSTIANSGEAITDLAEAVAQRSGKAARKIEKGITEQKAGIRERTYKQAAKGLKPGDYYADEQRMVSDLRKKADTLYDKAYEHGTVDDPVINEVLKSPSFKNFFDKAKEIADAEALAAKVRGEDPSKYELQNLYKVIRDDKLNPIGVEVTQLPDVRTLDYIKRGIDASIDAGYKSAKGMSTAEATALKKLRKGYVDRLDALVPDYKTARGSYAGDMEVIDAMRKGMDDFGGMDHEQVASLVKNMSDAEKQAFRTGVARDLYGRIMNPSSNFNAAQRIIGAPEMQDKLRPLFDSPKQFRVFKNALERESQLFHQSNNILANSRTAKRTDMGKKLEEGNEVGGFIADAVTGGFWNSLTKTALTGLRKTQMTDATADKLADMLMAKDPRQVAAAVKALENHAAQAAPKALKTSALERGTVTGTSSAIFPSPSDKETPKPIESDIETDIAAPSSGPSIEDDILKEESQQR